MVCYKSPIKLSDIKYHCMCVSDLESQHLLPLSCYKLHILLVPRSVTSVLIKKLGDAGE